MGISSIASGISNPREGPFRRGSRVRPGLTLNGSEAKEKRRKFEAVLTAAHKFEKRGKYTVACRVQDNLNGEAIKAIELKVEK